MARIPWYINSRPYSFEGGGDIFVGTQSEADKYAQSMGQHRGNQVSGVQNGLVRRAVDDKGNPVTMDGEQVYENPYMLDDVVVRAPNLQVAKAARERDGYGGLNTLATTAVSFPIGLGAWAMKGAKENVPKLWRRVHSNIYPFDYNRDGEGNEHSLPGKAWGALWRKDGGRDFVDRLAAADLSAPDTFQKFNDEFYELGSKNWLPGWKDKVNKYGLKYLQDCFRVRLDEMRMFDGEKQLYNSWKPNYDYTTSDGTPRYTFADPQKRYDFNKDAATYMRWRGGQNTLQTFSSPEEMQDLTKFYSRDKFGSQYHTTDVVPSRNGKKVLYKVQEGMYEPNGDYVMGHDYDGKNAWWADYWDYSMPNWVNRLMNVTPVPVGDRINTDIYDKTLASIKFKPTEPVTYTHVMPEVDADSHRWFGRE